MLPIMTPIATGRGKSSIAGNRTGMSDGGSIVNFVPAVRDGERADVEVVVSGDSVEIGGWTFARDDLLFALSAKDGEASPPVR